MQTVARIVAIIALGAAMTAAVVAMRGGTEDAHLQVHHQPMDQPAEPELARCRDLGLAAAEDAACKAAWGQHRRRFLETDEERPRP